MDTAIKTYADSLYEEAQLKASHQSLTEKAEYLKLRAARNPQSFLPLSGPDLQHLAEIQSRYIEQCMAARLESYETAYAEAGLTPTDGELNSILVEFQSVRSLKLKHAVAALRQSIASHGGGVPFLPDEPYLEQRSAHGHERVLQQWKSWRAKTQLKQKERKAEERERGVDSLMPIFNRAQFNQDIQNLSNSDFRVHSLLFMDLDKFKQINDGPGGHEAGDHALKQFGAVVLSATSGKGYAYRYGGDEVCVILPNHTIEEAAAVAERIRYEVREIRLPGGSSRLSTSIGVANFPRSTTDLSKLCSKADTAMYKSKELGGDRVTTAELETKG